MGDIKRKRSKIRKPKKKFNKTRIEDEKKIIVKYGLKNKKEIWKAEAEIVKLRRRAKQLIPKSEDEKKGFFEKLNHLGLKTKEISDVLGLTTQDWLERRLQTFVFKKGLANTIKQARQMITHKKILVDENVVNIPGFIVRTDLEGKILLTKQKTNIKKAEEVKKTKDEETKSKNRRSKPEASSGNMTDGKK